MCAVTTQIGILTIPVSINLGGISDDHRDAIIRHLATGHRLATCTFTSAGRTSIEETILLHGDLCNPLLEFTPSRSQVNGREGQQISIHENTFITDIFSILLFRNILFNSPYILAHFLPGNLRRFQFYSVSDFKDHIRSVSIYLAPHLQESFFCNQSAFGESHETLRRTSDCEKLWKVANCAGMRTLYLMLKSSRPFSSILQVIRKIHDSHELVGMGKRGAYLTAMDICMAGLANPPTVEEMGYVIQEYSPHAKITLIMLGLLHPDHSSPQDIQHAFQRF